MITLRNARADEVKELQDLNDQIFTENSDFDPDYDVNWAQSETGKRYFTELVNNPESLCLIAEDDEKKIGYLAAGPRDVPYCKSRYCELENLGVIPEYRKRGVGTLLIDECLKWAKKNFQRIYVNSYTKNVDAVEFYKKLGFYEIDISLEKDL